MTPTYLVHSVSVGHQPDGTPIGYVTLACTVEEAQAAGAMLYRDVTLEPVEDGYLGVETMPGTVTYDIDDPNDWTRFLDRLNGRVRTALRREEHWRRAIGRAAPATIRDLLGVKRSLLLQVSNIGEGTVREIREALVEGGLPDLAE